MAQKSIYAVLMTAFLSVFIVSCTNYEDEDTRTTGVERQFAKSELVHNVDTAQVNKAADRMSAELAVYTQQGLEVVDSVKFKENPTMDAEIFVEKDDYIITEEQLEPKLENSFISRSYEPTHVAAGGMEEQDTLWLSFNDGQIVNVPVTIMTYSRTVGEKEYFFGSDTLISARLISAKNINLDTPHTRASYVSATVNTEYKVELTFAEKNTQRDSVFTLNLTAYALRKVLSEDAIEKVEAENKSRVVLDATTEKLSFDRVITMKSGEVLTENISYILNRECQAIEPYEKIVSSFAYAFEKSNGVADGRETLVKTDGNWSVWGKTDKYSADISNKVKTELITTDYTLYHERATYKDSFIEVEFGYEDMEVTEVSTNVLTFDSDKEGYDKAELNNAVRATYLGYTHDLAEKVYLYMLAKIVTGYDIEKAELKVEDDKVIATLTWVTKFSDGSEVTFDEKAEFPWSVVTLSDWTSRESNANQETDTCIVTLAGTNTKSEGYWSYTQETRNISTLVKLGYGYNQKTNQWQTSTPNNIVYTREGKTYVFPALDFSAIEKGATVVLEKEEGSISTYKYTDKLDVTLGDHTITTTAPGTITVDGKAISGYDYRDAKLVIADNGVTAQLVWITKYLDGTEKTDNVSKTFPRSLECTTNWTAYEPNATQKTGNLTVSMASSETVMDGEWIYDKEIRSLTSIATLASSAQNNVWTSTDPNNIIFLCDGVKVDFGTIEYSAAVKSSSAELVKTEKNIETYAYNCGISVTYGNNLKNSVAPGTIIVEKEKVVTGHELRDKDVVVNDNDVTITFTYVTFYNDDTETTEAVSKSFPRSLTCYTNWLAVEDNAEQSTAMGYYDLANSEAKTDGFWSYVDETHTIITFATLNASKQTNGWKSINPNKFVYTRDGQTYTFEEIEFSAAEVGATVNLTTDRDGVMTYAYEDVVNVTYGNNTVRATAPGTISVAITVIGFDISNPLLQVTADNVLASLTWIIKYSNGTEKTENLQQILPRSLTCLTNWQSAEENANQQTGEALVNLLNAESKADGFWAWSNETRQITTIAALNGSKQSNKWQSVDPNAITFTREGKTYSFGALDFTARETGANVNVASDNEERTVYNYTDGIAVNFGENTVNGSAPGVITVDKPWIPDFPAEWGKFVKAESTVSVNEEVKDWVYTWSIHFENGTLPVVIRKNDAAVNIDKSLFEYLVDSRFNSASFVNGKWINSIASDEPNYMLWMGQQSNSYRIMPYTTATMWKWNNGHNTVKSDKFTFSVENGGKVLVVYKDGNVFASYKAAR